MLPEFLRYFKVIPDSDQSSTTTPFQDEWELSKKLDSNQRKVWYTFCANTPADQIGHLNKTQPLANCDLSNISQELKTARLENALATIDFEKQKEAEHFMGEELLLKQSTVWNEFCKNTPANQIGHFNGTKPLAQCDLSNIPLKLQQARYKNALMTLYHASDPQQSAASKSQLDYVQQGIWPRNLSLSDESLQQPQATTQRPSVPPGILQDQEPNISSFIHHIYEKRSHNNKAVFTVLENALRDLNQAEIPKITEPSPNNRDDLDFLKDTLRNLSGEIPKVMAYKARRSPQSSKTAGTETFMVTPCGSSYGTQNHIIVDQEGTEEESKVFQDLKSLGWSSQNHARHLNDAYQLRKIGVLWKILDGNEYRDVELAPKAKAAAEQLWKNKPPSNYLPVFLEPTPTLLKKMTPPPDEAAAPDSTKAQTKKVLIEIPIRRDEAPHVWQAISDAFDAQATRQTIPSNTESVLPPPPTPKTDGGRKKLTFSQLVSIKEIEGIKKIKLDQEDALFATLKQVFRLKTVDHFKAERRPEDDLIYLAPYDHQNQRSGNYFSLDSEHPWYAVLSENLDPADSIPDENSMVTTNTRRQARTPPTQGIR